MKAVSKRPNASDYPLRMVQNGAKARLVPYCKWRLLRVLAFILSGFACATSGDIALAHGGGLNAQGCHNNRKTGDYHCHRAASSETRAPARSNSGGVSYRNCAAARAAGVTPIRRGEPGYAKHLDRDNDGLACE